jgi:hypothetical protein
VREKAITPADHLLAEYEQTLTALRDLDFDHATGKIADEDHAPQRAQLAAQGAALLRQLDALGIQPATPATDDDDDIERAVAARRRSTTATGVDDRIEAEVAARRKAASGAGACPQCGTPFQPGDRFCARCGTRLSAAEPSG